MTPRTGLEVRDEDGHVAEDRLRAPGRHLGKKGGHVARPAGVVGEVPVAEAANLAEQLPDGRRPGRALGGEVLAQLRHDGGGVVWGKTGV